MESDRPSMVMMFRVNPKVWMNAKVAMTDVGSATALISVLRTLLRNTKMMSTARPAPSQRETWTSSMERRMNFDWSKVMSSFMPCGGLVAAMAAFTRSATATVFSPDWRLTERPTLVLPLKRVSDRSSSRPSSALPMSRSLISLPWRYAIAISLKAAGVSYSPLVLTIYSMREFSTRPPGTSRCSWPSARFTSSAVRAAASSFCRSSQNRTWRVRPPLIVTDPTPGIFSMSRFNTLSA